MSLYGEYLGNVHKQMEEETKVCDDCEEVHGEEAPPVKEQLDIPESEEIESD